MATVRPELVDSVIQHESGGNPNAKAPDSSATGLMQITKGVAKDYGVDPSTLKDPAINRDLGSRYLGDLIARRGGDERQGLIDYRQGPNKSEVTPVAAQYAENVLQDARPQNDNALAAEQAYAARKADDAKVQYGLAYLKAHPEERAGLGIQDTPAPTAGVQDASLTNAAGGKAGTWEGAQVQGGVLQPPAAVEAQRKAVEGGGTDTGQGAMTQAIHDTAKKVGTASGLSPDDAEWFGNAANTVTSVAMMGSMAATLADKIKGVKSGAEAVKAIEGMAPADEAAPAAAEGVQQSSTAELPAGGSAEPAAAAIQPPTDQAAAAAPTTPEGAPEPAVTPPEYATPQAATQTLAEKQAALFKQLQVGEGGAAEVGRPDLATKVSEKETLSQAKSLGLNIDDFKAMKMSDPEQAARMGALVQAVHGEATELRTSALDIMKRQAAGEDVSADSVAWLNRVNALAPQAARVAGERSAAGRVLQILDPLKNPETQMISQVNRFALESGDAQTAQDLMQMFAGKADPDAIAQQLGKMNENVQNGATLKGAISQYYYGAMLSRPRTLVKKTVGDVWSMALAIPKREIAAQYSQSLGSGQVAPAEAPAMVNAAMHSFGDALRVAGKTWANPSQSEFDRLYPGPEGAFEAPMNQISSATAFGGKFEDTAFGKGIDLMGHVIGLGPRSMGGLQDFARTMNMRMQIAALAERSAFQEALGKGLSGGEAGDYISQRVADLTNNTPPEMLANARNFATEQTYSSPLGPIMQGISDAMDKIPLGLGRFAFPFRRVPTDLWKFARDNSPLGITSKKVQSDIAAGGAQRDLALAQLGLGTAMAVKMGSWALDGHITGGGPSDPKLLHDLMNTGWKPYSFHVGDSYVPYGWAEPISMPLGIAADLHDTYAQADPENGAQKIEHIGGAIVMALGRNLSRQSYLQTFVNISKYFDDAKEGKDPLASVGEFAGRELRGLIPAAVQGEAQREDPVMRQTRGLMDTFMAGIPGYSKNLPAVRDLGGNKIPVPGGFMANEVYPFAIGHDPQDPVAHAIWDNHASIMPVPKLLPGSGVAQKYGMLSNDPDLGVPLTPQEQDRWSVLRASIKEPTTGKGMMDTLADVVADPQFKTAPQDIKAKTIESIVSGFSHGASGALMAESPSLQNRYQARMQYRDLARQGAAATASGGPMASSASPSIR